MSIVNSLLKPRALLPFCVALTLAGLAFPATGLSWFDQFGVTSAHADDDDRYDGYGDDDDRYQGDRYDDDHDDRYDDDHDDDDGDDGDDD
jgi:hypothetical protein